MFTDVEGQLETKEINKWNGLLFNGKAPKLDLKKYGIDDLIDFSKFHYSFSETTEYNFNWKSFTEVYLENYHILGLVIYHLYSFPIFAFQLV
jgi:phenylpropionate dioxygenase-like ring-hydroxylating dioxygenase large terminal subunit